MAQPDETLLLVNGLVWPGQGADPAARPQALAVRRGRVEALGSTAELRERFPVHAEVDLGGRAVVPGLVDGHNHSVRAGASWTRELDWARCSTGEEALALLEGAVAQAAPGQWIAAVGGWHPSQFGGWCPDRDLLDRVAPDNPVYLQALYEFGVVNTQALKTVPYAEVTPDSGRVYGMPAYSRLLAAMGEPGRDEQLAGFRAMYRDFAAVGITGVNDPGGFGMDRAKYETLYELWRAGELRSRLRLYFSCTAPGQEIAQVKDWIRTGFHDRGDDLLRPVGIGEVVHFGCHDFEGLEAGFWISSAAVDELDTITRLVAQAGLPMQIHGVLDTSITLILDCWERVNADIPVTGLRFAIAHCDRVSQANLARMKRLGVGVIVDDRQAFRAGASLAQWGDGTLDAVPPLADLAAAQVPFGAGTDATRASSYDPWRSLLWLIEGRSLDGRSVRAPQHLLTRPEALHAYTAANTWFSHEEGIRGRLEPGYLADLAVLNRDFFTVDSGDLLGTRSELTLVGGKPVYSSGALADPA